MEDLSVRAASIEETEAVKSFYDVVIEANTGTEYDVLWRRDLHPSDAALEAAIAAGELFLAFDQGEIVGAAVLNNDFAQGYDAAPWGIDAPLDKALCIHLFCVHPGRQGKGLGKRFLRELVRIMGERGFLTLRLDVFAYNTPAIRLYESVGFVNRGNAFLQYEDQEVSKIVFAMYEYIL